MPSLRQYLRTGHGKAASSQSLSAQSLSPSLGSPSPVTPQHGGISSATAVPIAGGSSNTGRLSGSPVAATTPSRARRVYEMVKAGFRVGSAAAEVFPPAKAVVAGLTEILKLIDVSFHYAHSPTVTNSRIYCVDQNMKQNEIAVKGTIARLGRLEKIISAHTDDQRITGMWHRSQV